MVMRFGKQPIFRMLYGGVNSKDCVLPSASFDTGLLGNVPKYLAAITLL